jgi:AAA domain
MVMTKLIAFAGANGTGKTSLAAQLVTDLHADHGIGCVAYGSIVRAFYSRMGVANETAFLEMSIGDRKDFQLELFAYYVTEIMRFLDESVFDVVVSERSVFCHYAYTVYGCDGALSKGDMQMLTLGVEQYLTMQPATFYLPYPTPWDEAAGVADGFRDRGVVKDTIVDALIYRLVSRYDALRAIPCVPVPYRAELVRSHLFAGRLLNRNMAAHESKR